MSDAVDVARTLFQNDEREFRCGWRVLAFFILLLIFSVGFGTIGLMVAAAVPGAVEALQSPPAPTGDVLSAVYFGIERLISLVSALAASAVCARLLERRTFSSTGYKLHKGWTRDWGLGLLLGALTLAGAVAIIASARAVHFTPHTDRAGSIVSNFLVLSLALLIAAALEEVMFRGFAFQALLHNLGPAWAISLTSCVFGLLHVFNPNVTIFSTVNIVLAGVWLGVAYLATRSLWLATALHFAWNFTTVFVFGLPVSGMTMYQSLALLRGEYDSATWLSGGSFGPEGGAAATLMLALSTVAIWKSGWFSATSEMVAAIQHGERRSQSADSRSA